MKKIVVLISLFSILFSFNTNCYSREEKTKEVKSPSLSKMTDAEFLNLVQKKAFLYFWNEANPKTGLVKDKTSTVLSSVAAVGFGLSSICIAEKRGWVEKEKAYNRILNTLKYFKNEIKHMHGFYPHFVHMNTGEMVPGTEISSIDTALFISGALFAGEYFKGTEIEKIADELYRRVDWQWMLNEGTTLSLGWKVNNFLFSRWNKYDESLILYILAIGSPTHPIPASSWNEIARPIRTYKDYTCIAFRSPLFVFQYPFLWVDFRNKHDKYANYFKNSINATLANRQFCIDQQENYETYSPNSWGITACDGPDGYKAYSVLPSVHASSHDGTVAPTAAATSMMFTPEESLKALKYMYSNFKDKLWGKYGFKDAYNLDRNWFSDEVIGIDQGALLMGIENYRSGMVWEYFMRNESIKKAMDAIGFKKGDKKVVKPPRPVVEAAKKKGEIKIDGNLEEWKNSEKFKIIYPEDLESGGVTDSKVDLGGEFYFKWDEDNLYFAAEVMDNDVEVPYSEHNIYRNDCVEVFVDPENNGLIWSNPADYQIGLSPGVEKEAQSWAWFQEGKTGDSVDVKSKLTEEGYTIEAAIKWGFLDIEPDENKKIGVSPAFHDLDYEDNTPTAKLNWHYIYKHKAPEKLGQLILNE